MSELQAVSSGTPLSRTRSQAAHERGILVVDDDVMVRAVTAMLLQQEGLPVRMAGNGAEAVEVYRRHGGDIALVLMDVRMPGMDGPHTLERLRELNPSVACYFMSGDWHPYTEDELVMEMGAIGLAHKPISEETLAEIVESCLINA
jgi:CheY-like chemotaxis protein